MAINETFEDNGSSPEFRIANGQRLALQVEGEFTALVTLERSIGAIAWHPVLTTAQPLSAFMPVPDVAEGSALYRITVSQFDDGEVQVSADAVDVPGENGSLLPVGAPREIVSFDAQGNAIATPLTADMWGDFEDGAPTDGQWVAAYVPENPAANPQKLGFLEVAYEEPTPNTVAFRTPDGGTLKTADATADDDAVTLAQLNERLSPAQRLAIDELVSPTEDYADLAAATAAVKALIDALQAT